MRKAQNICTHALNQLGVSQNPFLLLISTFGIRLEPGCKSHGQIIRYQTAENAPKQATVFLYFLTNSYNLTRKLFPVV